MIFSANFIVNWTGCLLKDPIPAQTGQTCRKSRVLGWVKFCLHCSRPVRSLEAQVAPPGPPGPPHRRNYLAVLKEFFNILLGPPLLGGSWGTARMAIFLRRSLILGPVSALMPGFNVFSICRSPLSPKPYNFIGFGAREGPKPYKFIGFGPRRTRTKAIKSLTNKNGRSALLAWCRRQTVDGGVSS